MTQNETLDRPQDWGPVLPKGLLVPHVGDFEREYANFSEPPETLYYSLLIHDVLVRPPGLVLKDLNTSRAIRRLQAHGLCIVSQPAEIKIDSRLHEFIREALEESGIQLLGPWEIPLLDVESLRKAREHLQRHSPNRVISTCGAIALGLQKYAEEVISGIVQLDNVIPLGGDTNWFPESEQWDERLRGTWLELQRQAISIAMPELPAFKDADEFVEFRESVIRWDELIAFRARLLAVAGEFAQRLAAGCKADEMRKWAKMKADAYVREEMVRLDARIKQSTRLERFRTGLGEAVRGVSLTNPLSFILPITFLGTLLERAIRDPREFARGLVTKHTNELKASPHLAFLWRLRAQSGSRKK